MLVLLLVHLTAIDGSTSMTLVGKSSIHHIGLGHLSTTEHMPRVTIHYYIIFLDNSDATYLIIISLLLVLCYVLLWMTMELLALKYMSTQHLWILNFNLRVVEDVVVIIDVLDYFYWLVLALLFWLRGSTTSLVSSV